MGGDLKGSHPSEISDEDSISLTSTISSVKEKNNEYVIDEIIAERDNDGTMEYLARWEGYPDERCTWEIKAHFTDVTLLEWETQKMRVARGYAEPYDVEALLDRVEAWISATRQRKSRRRAKRLRLGYPVSDEDDSYEEVEEVSSDEEDEEESPVGEISAGSTGATLPDGRRESSSKENKLSSSRPVAPVAKMARNRTEEELSGSLHDVPGAQSAKTNQMHGLGKAPTAVMFQPQKKDSGSAGSKSLSASSGTSPTEIFSGQAENARQRDQAAGLPKKGSSAAKSSPTKSKVGIDKRGSLPKNNSSEKEQASKLSSASSPKHAPLARRRASLAGPDSLRKRRKEPSPPEPVSPAIQNPRRRSLPQPSSKSTIKSSKTPRRSTEGIPGNSTGTKQTQINSSGRGPARLSLPKSKSSATSSDKVGVSGAAVLRNWNKAPKRRKSNAFQPGSSDKPFSKFSKLRKYEKRGRNEPAPDIDMLTFMDLKSGGVAKKSSLAIPKINPPKTPYQLIQERLKADGNAPPPTPYQFFQDGLEEDADAPPPMRSTEKSSLVINHDEESPHTSSPKLAAGQSANSELLGSNTTPVDLIPVSLLKQSSGPGQNIEKKSSTVSQDHLEEKSISRQLVPSRIHTQEVGISKALPTQDAPHAQGALPTRETLPFQDALGVPTTPRNERGHSNADQSSNISASLQDTSAFTAQPAPWSKGSSAYSRSYAPTQTSSKMLYGPTTLAQRNRITRVQMEIMHSGVENDILGNILIEQDSKDLGDLRFRGLDWPARQLFLTIKVPPRQVHVICKHICTTGEYQEFFRGESYDYICSGFVLPFVLSFGPVWHMAETLKTQASAAIFYSEEFSLIFYPNDAGLESWDFLNNSSAKVPEGTLLRFIMRKPLPPPPPDLVGLDITGNEALISSSSEGKSNINFVFQEILDIEYERLIKQPTPEKTAKSDHFFLFFVGVEKEFSLMCKFLAANGAKIYSWDDEGAWDYFCNHVETGVILIEGSFFQLHLIPNLTRCLSKPINVFNITFFVDELAPHPHINRLFPHGEAILVTDSFLLLHPREAARFLKWFRWVAIDGKPPGQWKLCFRPGIRDLLLTIIEQSSEKDGFVFMQMYENLWYIIPEDQVDDEDLEDDIVLDTDLDEKPVRCMSSGISNFDQTVGMNMVLSGLANEDKIARNDGILVEWFAGWAMTQLESHRRFNVISGSRSERLERQRTELEGKWSHIGMIAVENVPNHYKIPAWEREFEERKKNAKKGKEEIRKDKDKGKGNEKNEGEQTATAKMYGESIGEKTPMSA